MSKLKLVVFHSAIPPYRVDFFNALNEQFDANFYFFRRNVLTQTFDTDKIIQQLNFLPNFLTKGFEVGKKRRLVRFGYFKKITKHKPDLVLCLEYSFITFFISLLSKIFYPKMKVFTICDDSLDISIKCRGVRKVSRYICLNLLDGVILNGDQVQKWYDAHFPSVKTFVFPIIQNETLFRNKLKQTYSITLEYLKKYDLENNINLLYVGRLTEVKNLEFLIEVFAEYSVDKKNVVLIIVGDGNLKGKLMDLAKMNFCSDKVLFPGRFENEELHAWYSLADYFILPSTHEPFGAVVNEALIAGVPVLCSNIAGASSLINSENGFTFNPKDKKALLALLNDKINGKNKMFNEDILSDSLMPFTFGDRLEKLISFLSTRVSIFE